MTLAKAILISVAMLCAVGLIAIFAAAYGVFDDGDNESQAQTNGVTVPNPFENGTGGGRPCQLDKVGTWSEGNNPHRIEIGGHGGQHLDFYPSYQPRVYAVSYIVHRIANPDGIPDIAWGYGSLWEGDKPECASYDWAADATRYARARLDSGHSGLVIDLRSTPARVVANLRNLNQNDIMALLATHAAAMRKGERGFEIPIPQMAVAQQAPAAVPAQAVAPPANRANCGVIRSSGDYLSSEERLWFLDNCKAAPAPQQAQTAPQYVPAPAAVTAPEQGCPPAREATYTSNSDVTVQGPAIVHPWWNTGNTNFGQAQVRVLLRSGESATFVKMQGKSWSYENNSACNANLDREFSNASFPVKTVWELAQQSLAR